MNRKLKGFTLIELLVAVAIMAILSSIGISVFKGAQNNTRDTKVKADVEALAKAYEAKYNPTTGRYPTTLSSGDFTSGIIPSITPLWGTNNKSFTICASLVSGEWYCRNSAWGQTVLSTPTNLCAVQCVFGPTANGGSYPPDVNTIYVSDSDCEVARNICPKTGLYGLQYINWTENPDGSGRSGRLELFTSDVTGRPKINITRKYQ